MLLSYFHEVSLKGREDHIKARLLNNIHQGQYLLVVNFIMYQVDCFAPRDLIGFFVLRGLKLIDDGAVK